jgi:uncharacterized protein YjbI with pentapeptide repeats
MAAGTPILRLMPRSDTRSPSELEEPGIEIRHSRTGAVLLRVDRGDLVGAELRGARLRNADLDGAELGNADLRNADLRGARLAGADLRGADLRGANLRGADLRKASLRFVRYDRRTRWPWFFDLKGAMRM